MANSDDDEEEEEDATTVFSRSVISDLVSGRQTFFCCLSCGVPFALTNDAYLYDDEKISKFVRFTHGIRKQVRDFSGKTYLYLTCTSPTLTTRKRADLHARQDARVQHAVAAQPGPLPPPLPAQAD